MKWLVKILMKSGNFPIIIYYLEMPVPLLVCYIACWTNLKMICICTFILKIIYCFQKHWKQKNISINERSNTVKKTPCYRLLFQRPSFRIIAGLENKARFGKRSKCGTNQQLYIVLFQRGSGKAF